MRRRNSGSLRELLSALADDIVYLAGRHLALFRAETRLALRRVFSALVIAVLGLTAAASTLVFLGIALFEWFVEVLSSRLLAALSVAGVAGFIALCFLSWAFGRLVRTSFVPWRTLASLKRTMRDPFNEANDG